MKRSLLELHQSGKIYIKGLHSRLQPIVNWKWTKQLHISQTQIQCSCIV